MADVGQATAETQGTPPQVRTDTPKVTGSSKPRGPSRFEQLNRLYALPAPLRTFPLPTFVPHNPLSLFHILYIWVSQSIKNEPSHFDPVYQGWFSPDTRSIHVTDTRSIRGLWEQGFYGKGTLSRSEPSWHNREKTRLGTKTKQTSEEVTRARRTERQAMKWERARKEREAIDQKLLEEAEAALPPEKPQAEVIEDPKESDTPTIERKCPAKSTHVDPIPLVVERETGTVQTSVVIAAPVGPPELLALPNSQADLGNLGSNIVECFAEDLDEKFVQRFYAPPVGPMEILALPNSIKSYLISPSSVPTQDTAHGLLPVPYSDGHNSSNYGSDLRSEAQVEVQEAGRDALRIINHSSPEEPEVVGGSETNDETAEGSVHSEQTTETNETGSTLNNGPSSSPQIKRRKSVRFSPTVERNTFIQSEPPSPERAAEANPTIEEDPIVIKNQEHSQLTLEEAFFLSYGLGALNVLDQKTHLPISNEDLFTLFRKNSHFPPQVTTSPSPDDPFMTNYIVYHHFRSLGWVLRSGIKFSVDYVLYTRGPVFTHAEFCVLIIPSYTDPYWRSDPFVENYVKGKEKRTWHWLHCINRVVTQIKKTLILTYVDIPKPISVEEEKQLGIHGVLGRYKVREVVVKRFSANRMRD